MVPPRLTSQFGIEDSGYEFTMPLPSFLRANPVVLSPHLQLNWDKGQWLNLGHAGSKEKHTFQA
jgi:hypothetical protein